MSVDAWTVAGSIATMIGVIAAIVLGVIPLVRDRNKASAAYASPSTTSGAPQPAPTVATKAPTAAGPVRPASAPESRRGIGLRGVFSALLPFVALVLGVIISNYVKGQGFHGPLALLGIPVMLLLPVPFFRAGVRLRDYKLVLTGVVYGLVSLILWTMIVVESQEFWTGGFSESSARYLDGLGVSFLVLGVVATIHAFWLRRRVFARPS